MTNPGWPCDIDGESEGKVKAPGEEYVPQGIDHGAEDQRIEHHVVACLPALVKFKAGDNPA